MTTPEIKELFDSIYLKQRYLSASQSEFVSGCRTYFNRNKQLTLRQAASLKDIAKYLKAPEVVRYTNK